MVLVAHGCSGAASRRPSVFRAPRCLFVWAGPLCRPAISHVIPLQLVQILNLHRWNCNVFRLSPKVTVGNYVRLLLRWLSPSLLGPSAGHGHCSRAPLSSRNFARNSPVACSNNESVSLELQRFRAVSKNDRGKLCAKFVWWWPCERVLALPTCRSPHRGRVLWFLGVFRTSGACCAVVACPDSASHSVQNSPCLVLC